MGKVTFESGFGFGEAVGARLAEVGDGVLDAVEGAFVGVEVEVFDGEADDLWGVSGYRASLCILLGFERTSAGSSSRSMMVDI